MKKLFSLLTLALLSMTVWGKVVTFVPGTVSGGYSSATQADQMVSEGVTISTTKGAFGRTDNYRFAKDSETTFTSTVGNITKVEITCTAAYDAQYGSYGFNGSTGYTCQSGSVVGTWQGAAASFVLTAANGQVRATEIKVTIADSEVTTLENPVFTPGSCEFSQNTLTVTVSCPTTNATMAIYKVVDGEIDWSTYEYAFQSKELYVNETTTYAAQAYYEGEESEWVYATYTKVTPQVATPTFNPASGTEFEGELDVTISCATPGATIMYEYGDVIDEGVAPVTITLTESTTITAIASLDGYEDSEAATATYTKKEVTPLDPWQGTETYLASRDKGDFGGSAGAFNVFKEERPGINLAFSNGTIAQDAYRIYKSSTITFTSRVGNITAIEFIGVAGNPVSNFGEVEGMTYDGNNGTWIGEAATVSFKAVTAQVRCTEIRVTVGQEAVIVAAPVIAPENNTVFAGEQEVTITCSTEGAKIYYTIDEGDETLYEGPFNINASCTIKAYAKVGDAQSPEVSAKFILGTEINTIAEGNTVGQYYIYNGEAVVTYQNGSYTWIRDNSGSGLIYGYQVPQLSQGVVLKDGWTANYTVYKNVPEFQYPMGVEASEDVVAVEPFVRESVTTDNVNEYVVLKGITVLTDESNTKKFYNAADSLVLYNQFNIADSVLNIENGKTYDVEGIVYIFNETTLELYITNVTEVTAQEWALGDVNHDTFVNVADVTALIKYVLTSGDEPEEFYAEQANVDGDAAGVLNVADVTALIQLVLNQ